MLHPSPLGPLMVRYSSPLTTRGNTRDVRKLIHEGQVLELGCLMLAKNRPEVILDDGKLDDATSNYLVPLRDDFLPICHSASFYVEPYSSHRFNRQFGFCQRIPRVLLVDPRSREVSYEDALCYWKRLLFLSSMAQGTLPSRCLTLPQYVSFAYKAWWSKVSVNDLSTNISLLKKSTEVNSSQCKKDEEVGSSRKIQGKKGNAPIDDLDRKAPEFGSII